MQLLDEVEDLVADVVEEMADVRSPQAPRVLPFAVDAGRPAAGVAGREINAEPRSVLRAEMTVGGEEGSTPRGTRE